MNNILLKAATEYIESVNQHNEASSMRDEMELLDWQKWMEFSGQVRTSYHNSLVDTYTEYVNATGVYINNVSPKDRYAIAELAKYLVKKGGV